MLIFCLLIYIYSGMPHTLDRKVMNPVDLSGQSHQITHLIGKFSLLHTLPIQKASLEIKIRNLISIY